MTFRDYLGYQLPLHFIVIHSTKHLFCVRKPVRPDDSFVRLTVRFRVVSKEPTRAVGRVIWSTMLEVKEIIHKLKCKLKELFDKKESKPKRASYLENQTLQNEKTPAVKSLQTLPKEDRPTMKGEKTNCILMHWCLQRDFLHRTAQCTQFIS